MPSTRISVSWLTPARYEGVEEDVCRSRIKAKGDLAIGDIIPIAYKSGVYRAKIINLNPLKRGREESLESDSEDDMPLVSLVKRRGGVHEGESSLPPPASSPARASPAPAPVSSPARASPAPAPVTSPARATPAPAPVSSPARASPAPAPVSSPARASPAPAPVSSPARAPPAPAPVSSPARASPAPAPVSSPAPASSSLIAPPDSFDESVLMSTLLFPPPRDDLLQEVIAFQKQILARLATVEAEVAAARKSSDLNTAALAEAIKSLAAAQQSQPSICLKQGPSVIETGPDTVHIGHGSNTLAISKALYMDAFHKSANAQTLCLKLVNIFYTADELAERSYSGGISAAKDGGGSSIKVSLASELRFQCIIKQVAKVFPGSTTNPQLRNIRESVNAKCRNQAKSMS